MKPKNGEVKIESDIPIPPRKNNLGYAAAFRAMKVGDSVLVRSPVTGESARNSAQSALGVGSYCARKVDGGTRIWRTK